jgi:hypothetical protein
VTSRFWDRLGAEHAAALAANVMERVKRVQALRYFTRRWDLRRALSGQARYILPIDEIETSMKNYRLPPRWEPIFERRAPVQQLFGEAGWRRSG